MNIAQTISGNFMVLPKDSLGKQLLETSDFEPHFRIVAKNSIVPGTLVIDCGANLGYHTVQMAKMVGRGGKVVSIEPQRVIYQQMCGNVFMNDLRNVFAINAAVGDEDTHVHMDFVDVDADGVNIGNTRIGGGGELVPMVRIDDVVDGAVSFIKIDVQGCECKCLRGTKKIIEGSRPIMFVEVENHHLRCFGESSETLINQLLGMNYLVARIENKYPCDHVCIPREKSKLVSTVMNGIEKYSVIDAKRVSLRFGQDDINYETFTVLE